MGTKKRIAQSFLLCSKCRQNLGLESRLWVGYKDHIREEDRLWYPEKSLQALVLCRLHDLLQSSLASTRMAPRSFHSSGAKFHSQEMLVTAPGCSILPQNICFQLLMVSLGTLHWSMVTRSLTIKLKPSSRKKTAFSTNGDVSTVGYHVEEGKLIHSYLLVQSSSPSGWRNSTWNQIHWNCFPRPRLRTQTRSA